MGRVERCGSINGDIYFLYQKQMKMNLRLELNLMIYSGMFIWNINKTLKIE